MKKKIMIIVVLIVSMINICIMPSFAADTSLDIEEAITGADKFIEKGKEKVDDAEIQKASNSLVNLFIVAGTVIAVVYIGILGMKFMMGSVEEKAQIKETLIPFIVGCVVVFGAFTIWKIVILIGNGFSA